MVDESFGPSTQRIILKIVGFMVILRLSFSSYDASENEWIVKVESFDKTKLNYALYTTGHS